MWSGTEIDTTGADENAEMADEESPGAQDPEKKEFDRTFWDRFITEASFSYSDQPAPRHAGRNAVRMELPAPLRYLKLYRARGPNRIGVYVNFSSDQELELFALLREDRIELESEIGQKLNVRDSSNGSPARISVRKRLDIEDPETVEEQIRWLTEVANSFLVALRPRISRM